MCTVGYHEPLWGDSSTPMVVSFSQEMQSRYGCLRALVVDNLSIKQRMKQTWNERVQGAEGPSELEGTGLSILKGTVN